MHKLNEGQFAYPNKFRTTHTLVYAMDHWTFMLDCKYNQAMQVVFKDFSKAFDCMQLAILQECLFSLEIKPDLIELFINFLSERNQLVHINQEWGKSSWTQVVVGVPQGTGWSTHVAGIYWQNKLPSWSLLYGMQMMWAASCQFQIEEK